MRLKVAQASLYTHVMVVPNDGIRRTGRARVSVRRPITEYKKGKANG